MIRRGEAPRVIQLLQRFLDRQGEYPAAPTAGPGTFLDYQ
jgi:hypothetical protein